MNPLPAFPSTDWTRLERDRDLPAGDAWFCENYQPAILAYLHTRFPHHEAEDLCQEFFAKIVLKRALVAGAKRERGSLRALLRTALDNFLNNQARDRWAQKRGGGAWHRSLDQTPSLGTAPPISDPDAIPPDLAFDRAWAAVLLERALAATEEDCRKRGKHALFAALRPALDGSCPAPPHAEIAANLGLSTRDVTLALSRLRQRVARRLYEEVARTVNGSSQLAEEWASLRHALGAG